jgi:hypothetical protein
LEVLSLYFQRRGRGIAPNTASKAIDYGTFSSRSHDAVIRVYDAVGHVIETHGHAGDFTELCPAGGKGRVTVAACVEVKL